MSGGRRVAGGGRQVIYNARANKSQIANRKSAIRNPHSAFRTFPRSALCDKACLSRWRCILYLAGPAGMRAPGVLMPWRWCGRRAHLNCEHPSYPSPLRLRLFLQYSRAGRLLPAVHGGGRRAAGSGQRVAGRHRSLFLTSRPLAPSPPRPLAPRPLAPQDSVQAGAAR